jgi:regulator of replication initiation timing
MKTLFISALALALSIGSSKAENAAYPANKKMSSTNLASVVALRDENSQLRLEVELLREMVQELESSIAYERMMQNMFSQISAERQSEKTAEMDAMVAYNRLMANLFLRK